MARWKLTQPHYLKVPGTKWEYTENSRTSGRPLRKQFDVPLYLHPDDPSQWTFKRDRDDGDIIVCWEGKGDTSDLPFLGQPTPDMLPLDDEAKAVSAKLPMGMGFTDEVPEGGYAGRVLEGLSKQLADAMAANGASAANPQIDKLIEVQTKMMEQMSTLMMALGNQAVTAKSERRV